MELLIIFGIIFGVVVIGWIASLHRRAQQYEELKPRLDRLDSDERALAVARQAFDSEKTRTLQDIDRLKASIHTIADEKSRGFPWLAEAYADFFHLEEMKIARTLETRKHPARKAAEEVREIAGQRREAEKRFRIADYQLKYLQALFPWLEELIGQEVGPQDIEAEQTQEQKDDPASTWLSPEEFRKLSSVEKFQLALDRYRASRKSKWQIGRDYERYIGFLHEQDGYDVTYQGIVKGFDDLGRDIIAIKQDIVKIIQCKCWSQQRVIHEKHVFQTFGTTVEYALRAGGALHRAQHELFDPAVVFRKYKPTLVTSTRLSDLAKEFANLLHVDIVEGKQFEPYPIIKCNIARRSSEKIYHLPFDQQYDKVRIEPGRGEFFAMTVSEAERAGFRRAWRWRGE
jgi:hypothetical protein